jgi:uncharacterized membrane protein YccC
MEPAPVEETWQGHARTRTIWIALLIAAAAASLLAWLLPRWPWTRLPWTPGGHERALRRDLRRACRSGDSNQVHRHLLAYLRDHYQAPLGEAVRRFRDDGYGAVLDRLNATLYASDRSESADRVDARAVLDAVRELRHRNTSRGTGALPALYD